MEVIIVGCGPAGAYCAYKLAQKGIDVLILDHSIPREKPCGGGITQSVVDKFSEIKRFSSEGFASPCVRVFSCTNYEIETTRIGFAFNISRKYFDQEIFKLAVEAGAKFIREKVVDIRRKEKVWKVETSNQVLSAKIIIGADGINSLIRKKTIGQIQAENLGLGYGYLAEGTEKEPNTIKFLETIPGYIWVFPRGKVSCFGIGSETKYGSKFKALLDQFIRDHYPNIKVVSQFAALLPMVKNPVFFSLPAGGKDWALIGDAAGHADPITGEGILYALWSAKLASEAINRNDLLTYNESWKKEYGNRLMERARNRNSFYNPLRIELMIRFLDNKKSPFSDFLAGTNNRVQNRK